MDRLWGHKYSCGLKHFCPTEAEEVGALLITGCCVGISYEETFEMLHVSLPGFCGRVEWHEITVSHHVFQIEAELALTT